MDAGTRLQHGRRLGNGRTLNASHPSELDASSICCCCVCVCVSQLSRQSVEAAPPNLPPPPPSPTPPSTHGSLAATCSRRQSRNQNRRKVLGWAALFCVFLMKVGLLGVGGYTQPL